ncbi:NADH dehydrogenase subunit D [Tanacetum coccineum]
MWGGKKRLYSATKFILYTAGGSIFLLMGVLGIGLYGSNEPTLNFETSVNQSYPVALEIIFYIGFFIAFAVKLPILPLHTWLPDTHGEAHYSTCMLLAGILLKMGAYGLIRINMELLPHAHSIFSPWLMIVGIASITDTGLNGAILQIISHGFIGAALFFLAGTSYDRIRLVYLDEMGGVAIPMPKIFTMFSSFSMASLALPGIGMYPDFVLSLSVDKVEGFWFTRPVAAKACQKAFVTNRVGDFGLLLGILGFYWVTGSFEFRDLFQILNNLISNNEVNFLFVTLCAVLLFAGAIAKSAQFPLHVWLPDAMEGPTPISALIHAATMVAAGIFLVARLMPLFIVIPHIMNFISLIGIITVFLGATLALAQKDIKRGLAYSTMSQLGYMMLALGRIPTPEDAPESFRLFVRELRSLALELNHFLVSEKTFQLNRKEA